MIRIILFCVLKITLLRGVLPQKMGRHSSSWEGDRGGTVIKVLCYKSERSWFDPSWCHWNFHWHKILPIALWPWGRRSLEPKWVPGAFSGGIGGRCVRLTTYHHPGPLSRNLVTLTSWNPPGPSEPVTGLLYFYLYQSEQVIRENGYSILYENGQYLAYVFSY